MYTGERRGELLLFDTLFRNETKLHDHIVRKLKPGAIILLHDTSETTIAILPRLIDTIHKKGFRLIRLDKMLNLKPYA